MLLNYKQEWTRYYERNASKAQLHLRSVAARFILPEGWTYSSKTNFWQALVMEEVYQAQPSRRPTSTTGSPNIAAVTSTSSASSVSALDGQDTCGKARHRTRNSSPLTLNGASTFRTRPHGLQFVPMNPSTLRNEIRASPSPTSHSFTTPYPSVSPRLPRSS